MLNVAVFERQPKVSTLNMCSIADSEDTIHFKFGGTILSFTYFSFIFIAFLGVIVVLSVSFLNR